MKLGFNLKMEQRQELIMTQELRQAIELLQYNSIELNEYLEGQMQENPLLEMDGNLQDLLKPEEVSQGQELDWKEFIKKHDDISYQPQIDRNQEESNYEAYVSYNPSLKDHLLDQLNTSALDKEQLAIGEYIIENINGKGYLRVTIKEISSVFKKDAPYVEEVLKVIQSFDPLGVAARSLKECLKIQSQASEDVDPLLIQLIDKHLEDLAQNRMQKIAKALKIDMEQLNKLKKTIQSFEPMPGRAFSDDNQEKVRYIIPDASIEDRDGQFHISIKDVSGPRLRINSYYRDLMGKQVDGETNEFLSQRLNSALWIIKSIEQRRQTIYKVVESILKFQKDFFKYGKQGLVPLTLKDVAEDIDMHESTISRASNGKYLQTPQGIYELKYFFSSSLDGNQGEISSLSVKDRIKELIDEEDKKKPYSDQKISNILKEEGTSISRRTVAKYRDQLEIPSSTIRRQHV